MNYNGYEYLIIATVALGYIPMFWRLYFCQKKMAKLKRMVSEQEHCKLTGCYSRDHILELVERALAFHKRELVAHRHAEPLCIIFLDVDGLKQVNDACGHDAGDQFLRIFSKQLRTLLHRETDALGSTGRYGGDEFIVLLPGTRPEEAKRLLNSAQSFLETIHYMDGKCGTETIGLLSFSYGVSSTDDHPESVKELLKKADDRMYENKQDRKRGHK